MERLYDVFSFASTDRMVFNRLVVLFSIYDCVFSTAQTPIGAQYFLHSCQYVLVLQNIWIVCCAAWRFNCLQLFTRKMDPYS
jgi:hypothetical protein